MSIGTPSKKMRSECWSFFFSSLFGALCQRGRKLEGSATSSMLRRHGEEVVVARVMFVSV